MDDLKGILYLHRCRWCHTPYSRPRMESTSTRRRCEEQRTQRTTSSRALARLKSQHRRSLSTRSFRWIYTSIDGAEGFKYGCSVPTDGVY